MKIILLIISTVFLIQISGMTDILASPHVWYAGDGIGAWTGTPEGMEQLAISVIGAVISEGYSLGVAVLLLFPVLYFILKRKNIPRRPYFILALAGSLIFFGITNLVSFLQTLTTTPPLIDYSQPRILVWLLLSLITSIVEFSIGGILLYKSLVIRKLLKK